MPTFKLVLPTAAIAAVTFLLVVAVLWRTLRRKDRFFAEQLRESELDRERLQATFERGQRELSSANTQLALLATERVTAQQELLVQQSQAAECRKELGRASDQIAALQRKQRELSDRLTQAAAIRAELQAEKQDHEETRRALASSGCELEEQRRNRVELDGKLHLERLRVREIEEQRLALVAQTERLRQDRKSDQGQLASANLRLRAIPELEAEIAELRDRNSDLERKLQTVMQVASTVDAVELDREELQVRLDMAAGSVRIARNEADRYRVRTEVLEVDLVKLREELKILQASVLDQQGLATENRALTDRLSRQQGECQALQAKLDEQRREAEVQAGQAQQADQERLRLQQLAAESEHHRRSLQVQVQSLHQYAQQNEQLRAEVATLSQANQERHRIEAELVNVKTELRTAQATLRGASTNAQEFERLREVAQLLRDEKQSHAEAERRLLAAQAELQNLKGGISTAHGKRMEAEQLERTREENLRLKDELRQMRIHEKSTEELEVLTAEHRRVRLESELLLQRLEELKAAKQEATELRRQLEEQIQLVAEARELRDRQGLLEAQLYALGQIPQTREVPRHSLRIEIGSKSHDIEAGLIPLLANTRLRSIVLADVQGFPVVAAGEALAHEGLAAFSAVAQDVAERARRLLPISDAVMLHLVDANHMALSCRLFSIGHESFSIVAIGPEALELPQSDDVVMTLRRKMVANSE